MRMPRAVLPAIILSTTALSAQPVTLQPKTPDKTTLRRTVPLAEGARLKVQNVKGDIKVEAWDRPEVAFTGEFRPSRSGEQVKVVFEAGNDGFVIRGEFPGRRNGQGDEGPACRMTLKVPRHARLDLESVNGRIAVAGLAAPVLCEASNGAIHAEDLSGGLDAKTMNGALSLIRIQGRIQASTNNGAVHGKTLDGKGEGIEIHTVNGAVSLSKVKLEGSVLATAENGQVSMGTDGATKADATKHRAEATFPGEGAIRVGTANGGLILD